MTADELRSIGEQVFGYGWQTKLAAYLRVADRTIRRWVAGAPIPDSVASEMRALVSIPAPPATGRSAACVIALDPRLSLLTDQARAVGWTDQEIVEALQVFADNLREIP